MQRMPRATARWVFPTPGGPSSRTLAASGTKERPASSRTLALVDRRLEGEVEVLEGALKREMREPRPSNEVPRTPRSHFDAEQIGEEIRVRQLAFRRRLQPGFQHLGGLGEPQLL